MSTVQDLVRADSPYKTKNAFMLTYILPLWVTGVVGRKMRLGLGYARPMHSNH
jgi:hypothetical protein